MTGLLLREQQQSSAACDAVIFLRPDVWFFNDIDMTPCACPSIFHAVTHCPTHAGMRLAFAASLLMLATRAQVRARVGVATELRRRRRKMADCAVLSRLCKSCSSRMRPLSRTTLVTASCIESS